MNLQSIVALGAFFILLGYRDVASSNMMDDDLFCGYSDADEDFCSSYCYKSVKPPLNYIIELKDQIKANAQEHLDSHREIKEIRRKLLDINNYRDHIEDLRKSNDHLRKTNDILMESVRWNNNHNEDMCKDNKLKAEKDLSESIAKQDQQIFNKCKRILNNLLNEKDNVIKNLKKELKDHQTKEENFKNEIEQLKLQLQSYQDTSPKIPETIAKTGCQDLSSGIHRITIPGLDPFSALCNGEIDGGDWLVIEKRFDGSENFYRNWTEYRNGFGKLDGEFFIGLEKLHRITNSNTYELYIQLTYFDGADEFAHYNNFRIANENEKYKLLTVGNFSGTTGNRLQWDKGALFSTYDQDNEQDKNLNWAVESHGGWWYRNMYDGINLNGRYYESQIVAVDSMSWYLYESLKGVQMLIRPKS